MIMRKIKNLIAACTSRLLRAALVRLCSDLELSRAFRAATSSAALVDSLMPAASACSSREEVIQAAKNAAHVTGFICELGVFRGHSLNHIAKLFPDEKVYGFDTFTGLPQFWRDGFPAGAFDVSGEDLKFESNCVLYKGLFDETLPQFLGDVPSMAKLIHIDCDLYTSTNTALTILASRIQAGTIIVFDEYFNYPNWQHHEHRAFREFLEHSGFGCRYIAYNNTGQQVAVKIIDLPTDEHDART